jgi:hypothetical protein
MVLFWTPPELLYMIARYWKLDFYDGTYTSQGKQRDPLSSHKTLLIKSSLGLWKSEPLKIHLISAKLQINLVR